MSAHSLTYDQMLKAMAFDGEPIRSWQKYKLWIVEDYRVYPWAAIGFNAVLPARLLGALEVAALRVGAQIVYQMAGLAKQFMDDDKLRTLGWWPQLKNGHERDAARHAAYFLIRQRMPLPSLSLGLGVGGSYGCSHGGARGRGNVKRRGT